MLRLRLLIVLVVVSSLFAVSCSRNKKSADSEFLLIGTQGPLTGPIEFYGTQALGGVKLAVEEVNRTGGVNGKQIKLISFDSMGDAKESLVMASKLVASDVCAVIGEPTSGSFLSSRSAYDRHSVPVISPGATAEGVTEGLDYVFRTTLQDSTGAPYLVDYLIDKKGHKNYAIIINTADSYSVSLGDLFRQQLKKRNANIVADARIFGQPTDVSNELKSLRGKDIDAVIYSGFHPEGAVILKEMERQGIDAILVGADGLQQTGLTPLVGDLALGAIYYSGFSPNLDSDLVRTFNQMTSQLNLVSDVLIAQAYDTANIIFSVMKKTGVTNCSPESRNKIKSGLSKVRNYQGVAGTLSFDSEGSAIKNPFISEIYKTGTGEYSTRVLE